MKYIIAFIIGFMIGWAPGVNAGMLDPDGNPVPDAHGTELGVKLLEASNYDLGDVTFHCDMHGYFIYDSTIYQCVKIREGVTKAEIREHAVKENARLRARYAEILRYRQEAKDHK